MSKRNIPDQFDFHFYNTDNDEGLDDDINVIPFPDIPNIHPKYWFGTEDFKYGMARCWDEQNFVFNTHNFKYNATGRFIFFDPMLLSNVTLPPSSPII